MDRATDASLAIRSLLLYGQKAAGRDKVMIASMEFVVGVATVIVTLWLGWSARASATGPVRRIAMMPWIEEYFVVFLLAALIAGAVLIATAAGGA